MEAPGYSLPRDQQESSRLNLQHNVYKVNTGYLLHPRIASSLPENARVAEVGTGTGIWLRELAAESPPGWTFTGFDISEDQFPPERVGQVAFEQLNILEEVPRAWESQFDAVHLRLLICGLKTPDWAVAAKNILRLLKPGGWIQWHECDFANMRPPVFQQVPGAPSTACWELYRLALKGQQTQGKMSADDIVNLLDRVQSAGFEDCGEDVIASDRVAETRGDATIVEYGAFVALAKGFLKGGYSGMSMEQVEELCQRAGDELADGKLYCRWDMYIITGRKPMS